MSKHKSLWVISGVLAGLLSSSACSNSHTVLTPLKAGSSAEKYLPEFKKYQYSEAGQDIAPDKSAKIEDRRIPPIPFAFLFGCHEVWYTPDTGDTEDHRKILTARELDRGSGRSFLWGWSRDSKAIFIRGGHAGLDCRGPRGSLSIIYTIADGTAWEVPGE